MRMPFSATCALSATPRLVLRLAAVLSIVAATPAAAELQIAQIAPLTGSIAVEGLEYNAGIALAVAAVNASGGIHGQRLRLVSEDDAYQPERTLELAQRHAASETLALIMPVGSPSMSRLLQGKHLERWRLPVVGVVPGAEPLRVHHPYIFHTRASDNEQVRKIVEHALTIGQRRIAVIYVDNPFGHAGRNTVESLLRAEGLAPAETIPLPTTGAIDAQTTLETLRTKAPDLIVLITPGQRAGEFVRTAHAAGLAIPIATLSYGTAEALCHIAGNEGAHGVAVAQVLPNFRSNILPLARRFREDTRRHASTGRGNSTSTTGSQSQFEGYVTALALIEGLRRAGPEPTRERLRLALEQLRDFDPGGFSLRFSAERHTGSSFVDIGLIGKNCQLVF